MWDVWQMCLTTTNTASFDLALMDASSFLEYYSSRAEMVAKLIRLFAVECVHIIFLLDD